MADSSPKIPRFLGIYNAGTPRNRPFGSLTRADDVVLDDEGALHHRPAVLPGVALAGVTDAFQLDHFHYALVMADGVLWSVWPGGVMRELGGGYADGTYYWAQMGEFVAFAGETESGIVVDGARLLPLSMPIPNLTIITQPGGLPPGLYQFTACFRDLATGVTGPATPIMTIQTDNPCAFEIHATTWTGHEADVFATASAGPDGGGTVESYLGTTTGQLLVYDDASQLLEPLPDGQIGTFPLLPGVRALAFHGGCLWGAIYQPDAGGEADDKSLLFRSQPGEFRWFRYFGDAFDIPGQVLGMVSTDDGLLVATDKAVFHFSLDEVEVAPGITLPRQDTLARYGAVPGLPVAKTADGAAYIWTVRGLCRYVPGAGWQNLYQTDGGGWKLSVKPGESGHTQIIHYNGLTLALIVTDGQGQPFNSYLQGRATHHG